MTQTFSTWTHDTPATREDALSTFLRMRPRLYGIAYRMLRSAAAAEDVVQDVWIRWQTTDRSVVRDAAAFLAATTTRQALRATSQRPRSYYASQVARGSGTTPGKMPGLSLR